MNLRHYILVYKIYNFFHAKELKHNLPLYKKYGIKKKYYDSVSSEDFRGLTSALNIYDELDSANEMPKSKEFKSFPEHIQSSVLPWSHKGYVILKKFFSDAEIDQCNAEIERLLDDGKLKFKNGNKLMFAIHKSKHIQQMGKNDKLINILNFLMGKKVELFQSINFLEGSKQRTHSDSIHMTTFPYGNLIAVWVALEDITLDSGPLHYYPGSHKLPYVMNRDYDNIGTQHTLGSKKYTDYEDHIADIIQEKNLKKDIFTAQKGDILIWHANLLHGGEPVLNPNSTRKSLVLHYYAENAICFHEITQRPTLKK